MSKFNTPNTNHTLTENLAGGEAYQESPKLELASVLLTSFVEDQFYKSAGDGIKTITKLIDKIADKKFPAKAAIYARTKFGMRSVTHVVAAELANRVKGEVWTKNFYRDVVYRPDDVTEILAYYSKKFGKPIPNSLKKGLGLALGKFDAYQLAKYRKDESEVALVDAVNLVHPKPTEKNREALEKLVKDELKSFDTWETELTKAGQVAKDDEEKEQLKADAWAKLIAEKKIGYFALLRNLRNILEQAPEVVDQAIVLLQDEALIKKSLVLPFRFATALEQIEQVDGVESISVRKVIAALSKALDISVSNVPTFDGSTLVVLDESGSMGDKGDPKSPFSIGSLFAAVLVKSNNADFMGFADSAAYRNLNTSDSTLTIQELIDRRRNNGGTNFHAPFQVANKAYDRIIILSDMQGWMGYDAPTRDLAMYKSRTGANPKVFSFDLQGYGTLQFPENNVYCLAGFSEKIFDIMKLLETDRKALISEIEKVEL
jgi:60 kDa SS-A/Ro ribonucleoprotein